MNWSGFTHVNFLFCSEIYIQKSCNQGKLGHCYVIWINIEQNQRASCWYIFCPLFLVVGGNFQKTTSKAAPPFMCLLTNKADDKVTDNTYDIWIMLLFWFFCFFFSCFYNPFHNFPIIYEFTNYGLNCLVTW